LAKTEAMVVSVARRYRSCDRPYSVEVSNGRSRITSKAERNLAANPDVAPFSSSEFVVLFISQFQLLGIFAHPTINFYHDPTSQ
jgi:hypothetical protein